MSMAGPEHRLGMRWAASVAGLAGLSLLPGLGTSSRLSYHEAIVAQGAREMLRAGSWLVPTIDGRPWLEKPPMAHWLVMLSGRIVGEVSELAARLPSAIAGILLALGLAMLVARRYGRNIGGLAGGIQATMGWLVVRGRLADADILLACLVTWTIVVFDRVRIETNPTRRRRLARLFLIGLGATALAKGIGFGGALVVATAAVVLLWDRDRDTLRALLDPPGLGLALLIATAWPLTIVSTFPEAIGLWTSHIADRLADRPEVFAGRSAWWAYLPAVFGLALPWTPLACVAWRPSIVRAVREPKGLDRLLWAWAVVPIMLLSLATIKNDHYAIYALPPWAAWTAIGLTRLGAWLEARGRSRRGMQVRLATLLVGFALAFGLGFAILGPRFDRRGVEWSFYRSASDRTNPAEPLVLLYDDWDRLPYPTPFGPVPHDLAVRLYYLNRPATWTQATDFRFDRSFSVIARPRDLQKLAALGRVETTVEGPPVRFDRTYVLYRIHPASTISTDPDVVRASADAP